MLASRSPRVILDFLGLKLRNWDLPALLLPGSWLRDWTIRLTL